MGTWAAGNFRGRSCSSCQECRTGLFGTFSLFRDSLSGHGLERVQDWGFSDHAEASQEFQPNRIKGQSVMFLKRGAASPSLVGSGQLFLITVSKPPACWANITGFLIFLQAKYGTLSPEP